jgi:hypothetical protein
VKGQSKWPVAKKKNQKKNIKLQKKIQLKFIGELRQALATIGKPSMSGVSHL